MLSRILSAMLLIATLYVAAVFFLPKEADEIGSLAGIRPFNDQLRELKKRSETVSDSLSSKLEYTGGVIDGVQDAVWTAREAAEQGKNLIQTKVEQGKKIVDTASELNDSIKNFTSLTGSTASGQKTNAP